LKVVLIAGEPATGKTTLARGVLSELGFGAPFKFGKVVGTCHEVGGGSSSQLRSIRVYVLGIYGSGEGFWGTDRLSMAVLPEIKTWLATLRDEDSVFMEGDRVTSKTFVEHLRTTYDFFGAVLTVSQKTLTQRRNARGNKQSEVFLKGRRTKINNLVDGGSMKVFQCDLPEVPQGLRKLILNQLGASENRSRSLRKYQA
jgi:hypothetical protein